MSEQIALTLPDGSVREVAKGTTIKEVATSIGPRLGDAAIGGIVTPADPDAAQILRRGQPKIVDVHTPLTADASLKIITTKSEEGLEVLRHSASHLLASAVQKLFPGTQVTFGPAVEGGFYYDFHRPEGPFTPDDLSGIEQEMQRIAEANTPFVREEISRDAARQLFTGMGEGFKAEHVDTLAQDATITLYKHGDWVDLCEGPHIPSTKFLRHFKLTRVAGAYWRGDESRPMLTRIYGTCFWDKKALKGHLLAIEEAKKRDHRKVGKELDLFSFHDLAPAMPFFHPKGASVYNGLTDFIRGYYDALGFDEVITPQVVDSELFHRSGHYDNYKENMFFSLVDEREYSVKPMNCPGHTLIYSSSKRSYRDLPIRYADFGRLHRYERSGVTAGLTRVRSFAQDDAHIFCREQQISAEISKQIAMVSDVYEKFGFAMRIGFSTRPAKAIGYEPGLSGEERGAWDDIWNNAEERLRQVFIDEKLDYRLNEGDGAFYGPKIDFEVRDAIGRWHQLGTIQLDFAMPRRFGLKYTNEEGNSATPVMVHRAVLGSLERFTGILIEHCGGDFPVWLAPKQVRVLTINNDADLAAYAQQLAVRLHREGIRVGVDRRNEKLGFKIRDAELHKIPYVMVLGKKEMETDQVAVRRRKGGDLGQMALDRAVSLMVDAATVPGPSEALLARVEQVFAL